MVGGGAIAMSKDAIRLVALAFAYAWCVVVFGTCTYLVFWQGHSGWWFLLAFLLCSGASS